MMENRNVSNVGRDIAFFTFIWIYCLLWVHVRLRPVSQLHQILCINSQIYGEQWTPCLRDEAHQAYHFRPHSPSAPLKLPQEVVGWTNLASGELRKSVGKYIRISSEDRGTVHCLRLPKGQKNASINFWSDENKILCTPHTCWSKHHVFKRLFTGLGQDIVHPKFGCSTQTWQCFRGSEILTPQPFEWIGGWGLMDGSEPVLQNGCFCRISHI